MSVLSKGLLCLPHGCCPAQRHFDVPSSRCGSSVPKTSEEEQQQPDRPRPEVSLVRLIYVFVRPPQQQQQHEQQSSTQSPLCVSSVLCPEDSSLAVLTKKSAAVVLHMQKPELRHVAVVFTWTSLASPDRDLSRGYVNFDPPSLSFLQSFPTANHRWPRQREAL